MTHSQKTPHAAIFNKTSGRPAVGVAIVEECEGVANLLRETVEKRLKHYHPAISVSPNGAVGLEVIKGLLKPEHPPGEERPIDLKLIICDGWMPQKDGLQMLRELKAFADENEIKLPKIVIFTADPDMGQQAVKEGVADTWLAKPTQHEGILQVIDSALPLRGVSPREAFAKRKLPRALTNGVSDDTVIER